MRENPFESPDAEIVPADSSSVDRFRMRMKSVFRVLSLVLGLLAIAGLANGCYHLWNEWGREINHEVSVLMVVSAVVTGVCSAGLFWVSKRL
jgi:hypothetical protein